MTHLNNVLLEGFVKQYEAGNIMLAVDDAIITVLLQPCDIDKKQFNAGDFVRIVGKIAGRGETVYIAASSTQIMQPAEKPQQQPAEPRQLEMFEA